MLCQRLTFLVIVELSILSAHFQLFSNIKALPLSIIFLIIRQINEMAGLHTFISPIHGLPRYTEVQNKAVCILKMMSSGISIRL